MQTKSHLQLYSGLRMQQMTTRLCGRYCMFTVSEPFEHRKLISSSDSRDAWRSFSSFTSTKPVGLFCNNELKSAEGFIRYAHRCISKAQAIVDQISNAYTP